jgi:hypothetical protein
VSSNIVVINGTETIPEELIVLSYFKKSLKIPKGQSKSVHRRTNNTMTKRESTKGQTTINKAYI